MKKKLLVLLFSLATLGLVSCGGGNDVASSGTSAVSAAAPASNASPASAPSTAATEPKVNGQIDERTGCLLYTSPSPRDRTRSRMPSSA